MSRQRGFTLLELLVAMVLSAVLVAMVFKVMTQTVTNNQAIEGSLENLNEMAALRRLLGRDLRSMVYEDKIFTIDSDGFMLATSHNLLTDGPLPVVVAWRFTDGSVVRVEESQELKYRREIELLPLAGDASMAFFEPRQKLWVDWKSWVAPGVDRPQPGAVRLVLDTGREKIEIVERIPDGPAPKR